MEYVLFWFLVVVQIQIFPILKDAILEKVKMWVWVFCLVFCSGFLGGLVGCSWWGLALGGFFLREVSIFTNISVLKCNF